MKMRQLWFAWAGLIVTLGAQAQTLETLVQGLQVPWAVAFLPDGRFLITERDGNLRTARAGEAPSSPLQGVPKVDVNGQGGLLDLRLDSDFARNRTLYLCYAEASVDGKTNSTALARARLSDDAKQLTDVKRLFSQAPKVKSSLHFGCRIAELPDGSLVLALGERFSQMQQAQNLGNHLGKTVRLTKDGGVPPDNPFVGRAGAAPEVYTYGHRNPQGAALDAQGRLWVSEHGPQGGDELNLIRPGLNYGWPVITHGENYGGGKIGEGLTSKDGMEQPVVQWTPSIAPSGLAHLKSNRYGPDWQGSFFLGSLKFGYLERVKLDAQQRVVAQERLFAGIGRLRDVREGPDGLLYLLVEANGSLVRVNPR
ncbi:PQQ-dependent sugar dehydrogenase [Roseateles paludis]